MPGTVYLIASKPFGTLYIGVTNDIARGTYEHREGLAEGFTRKHACKLLVWYEHHESIEAAIQREKSLKRYPRQWKLNLIAELNSGWADLYETLNS